MAIAEGFSPTGLLAQCRSRDVDVRDVMVRQFLGRLLAVFDNVTRIGFVSDDADRARAGLADQPLRGLVKLHCGDTEFKCRMSRDGTETTMMPPMKQAAILTPSGRSMMFTMAV